MRLAVLLLVPSLAAAETRFKLHAGGGFETPLGKGDPPPLIGALGVGVDRMHERFGFGVVVERVLYGVHEREYALDAVFRVRNPKNGFIGGFGAGVRRYDVPREDLRPGSTIWGVDVVRLTIEFPLVRLDHSSLDFYFGWSFGIYHGERYGDRVGDMPFPVEDETTIANSYVLGLQTSFYTNP